MALDDLDLWELASRATEALRPEVLDRLAADDDQRERVRELLAQPAPSRGEGARYEIVGLIGSGTQAEVYQARRLDLDRACALKVFRNVSDPSFVERVRAEAGLMARVLSPHVVPVFDAGDLGDGRFFIEMALCAEPDPSGPPGSIAVGRSLRTWVAERGPLAPDDAARLLQPICAAVAAAHQAGVVHSDVKPENVLVLPSSRRSMLADFGIAAGLARPQGAARVGTIAYLAPEQFDGLRPPSAASDVYALGGTLLYALSGRAPHPERLADGSDPRHGAPVALPPAVPRSLAEIVERALSHDAAARPKAAELADALDAFLARLPTAWELRRPGRRASLFYQRHRVLVNLTFFGLVLAGTMGLGLLRTVVAKTGLENRAEELSGQVDGLDADVRRLEEQRSGLEAELARLRSDRETIAGAEAREREGRLRAEGRSEEADQQLTATTALARETAARLARAEATAAGLEIRLTGAESRARTAEADLAARRLEARTEADRYRASVEALRQGWEESVIRLRADVSREREAIAALQQRVAEAERDRAASVQLRAASEARLEGRLEACRADRDELRQELEALREGRRTSPTAPAAPGATN